MNPTLDRPKHRITRLAILVATAALLAVGTAPAALSELSSASAKRPTKPILKVNARIRVNISSGSTLKPVSVFFDPPVINVGTVIIVARNTDDQSAHQLTINGVTSRWMGPSSGTAVIKVTFPRPGKYAVGVNGGIDDGETLQTSLIRVIK